jgi:YHS domain-containing protein
MRIVSTSFALAAALMLIASACVMAADTPKTDASKRVAQTLCPITGKAINKDISVDYKGKRVYFCSADCPAVFNKDPDKYIKEMEAKGITLDKLQTMCPVMGGKITKDSFADYKGQRVYFCCPMCPPEFKKDPEKFLQKMAAEGVVTEKAPAATPEKK